jgi:hypothetical protein
VSLSTHTARAKHPHAVFEQVLCTHSFLLFPVELWVQPLDPAPSLQPHYRPSTLQRAGPPQCSASVRSPRGFSHLCFSLGIRAPGSRSSARKPESDSRPLHAGCHLPNTQVPGRLVPEVEDAPGFDRRVFSLRRVIEGSLPFVSLTLTCSRYRLDALTPTLTTDGLHRSSLEWFEACSWKPTPKGPPSSLVQLTHSRVSPFWDLPFCAPCGAILNF